MPKTLILYATRMGATADTANVIGEALNSKYTHDVKVCSIKDKKQINISDYDNIIIGSSITAGNWKGNIKRYLKKQNLTGKKTAVFVSAGGMMKAYSDGEISREEAVSRAVKDYIDPVMNNIGITPVSKSAFGGRFIFFGKVKFENWNREDILKWSDELGGILK